MALELGQSHGWMYELYFCIMLPTATVPLMITGLTESNPPCMRSVGLSVICSLIYIYIYIYTLITTYVAHDRHFSLKIEAADTIETFTTIYNITCVINKNPFISQSVLRQVIASSDVFSSQNTILCFQFLISLRSSSSRLRLLPRLHVTSIPHSVFIITCFIRQC
jgi:Ca2+/H+ antiporter